MKHLFSIKIHLWLLAAATLGLNGIVSDIQAQTETVLEIGKFSAAASAQDDFPPGWEPLIFKKITRHTEYTLVKDNGVMVVKAVSEASASGLIHKIKIDPRTYPIVKWRWKATSIFKKGDVSKKAGDDYPARLYIAFEYDPKKLSFFERTRYKAVRLLYGEYPPNAAITYIWSSKAPRGTMVSNPYTDRVKMIVVESGESSLNTWVEEERNVLEDYKAAFSQEPPMIGAIMIMTDSDNTRESAISYFGDIFFKQK
ncbi:MAG: DUF3047 domain-containing protein [Desulfobacterales bacterium]|jgi:hypothetical protein